MSRPTARLNDMCTGHGCYPSRPNDSASMNVFINGRGAHRLNDHWMTHKCKHSHDGVLVSGSSKVFVNGRPLGRIGDMIGGTSCHSLVATGSFDVLAG